ncbi:MAG: biopolymer transporter ExbD [Myxococcota bacterium]
MAFDRYRRTREAVELDLIPVMNLLVILIPFLLMGASFFHIGIIPASLPSHTVADPPPEPPAEITLNLVVKANQLEFTASSPELDEAALQGLARSFSWTGVSSGAAVQQYVKGLKRRFPTSDTVIVLPESDIKYERLVQVLDAVRDYETGETDSDGNEVRSELFNVVVFSRLITADQSQGASAEGAASEGGSP